jgi:hypothetical protein
MVLPPLLVIACSIVYAPHALTFVGRTSTFVTCSNCEVKANTTEGEEAAATRNAKSHQVAQDVARG